MPTVRGWLTLATAFALWGTGRMLGADPLEQIGFALVVLVVAAAVVVNARGHDLRARREVLPARARRGQVVTVKLHIANAGKRPAPLLLMDDRLPVELSAHARFALSGVEPDGHREASYELRATRRGRYLIGPLEISVIDPFGLTQTRTTMAGPSELLVHPAIEKLSLPRDRGRQRSLSVSALRHLSGARGEDFYTLRDYGIGDDLRKIHWPSTAKAGKPMIRQEETPWHNRATILLDDRAPAHEGAGDASSFERCVEAVASLAAMYHSSAHSYRIAGALHPGLPSGRGTHHLHRVLDLLAVVTPRPVPPGRDDPLLVRLAELEAGSAAEGTLVVVAGTLSSAAATALSLCRRRFHQVLAISFPSHRFGVRTTRERWSGEEESRATASLLQRRGIPTLTLGPGESLTAAWSSGASGTARGGDAPWAPRPERV